MPALHHVRLTLHRPRGHHQQRVAFRLGKGLGASGRQQRLVIFGTQVEQKAESVEQQATHRMLGCLAQTRRGACECVARNVTRTEHMECRHATQRAQGELMRCPLRAGDRLVDQSQCALGERKTLGRA